MRIYIAAVLLWAGINLGWSQETKPPVTYAIMGLAHDHARGFIPRARNRPELQLAGIVEPNQELAALYARQFKLPTNLFSPSLEALLALTQHIKPEVYPNVEDEATILLAYPQAQGIIQASWNWPFDRKDMEVYGRTGYVLVPQKDLLRVRKSGTEESELKLLPPPVPSASTDEISYLAAVVRGEIKPSGLSSLEVNLVVTEILDAARQSAQTGKRIDLPVSPPW